MPKAPKKSFSLGYTRIGWSGVVCAPPPLGVGWGPSPLGGGVDKGEGGYH